MIKSCDLLLVHRDTLVSSNSATLPSSAPEQQMQRPEPSLTFPTYDMLILLIPGDALLLTAVQSVGLDEK
jgi:hypothetical protein